MLSEQEATDAYDTLYRFLAAPGSIPKMRRLAARRVLLKMHP